MHNNRNAISSNKCLLVLPFSPLTLFIVIVQFALVTLSSKVFSLPGVAFFHSVFYQYGNLFVAYQPPCRSYLVARRHLAGKAFHHYVGAEVFEEVDNEIDVFVEFEE